MLFLKARNYVHLSHMLMIASLAAFTKKGGFLGRRRPWGKSRVARQNKFFEL